MEISRLIFSRETKEKMNNLFQISMIIMTLEWIITIVE